MRAVLKMKGLGARHRHKTGAHPDPMQCAAKLEDSLLHGFRRILIKLGVRIRAGRAWSGAHSLMRKKALHRSYRLPSFYYRELCNSE